MLVTGDGEDDSIWTMDEGYDALEEWAQRVLPSTHGMLVMMRDSSRPRADFRTGGFADTAFSLDVGRDWLIQQLQEQLHDRTD